MQKKLARKELKESMIKIIIHILFAFVISACITVENKPSVVERKKLRSQWAEEDAYKVRKLENGTIEITAFESDAVSLETGAEKAFTKANHKLVNFFAEEYFGDLQNAQFQLHVKEVSEQILEEKRASALYSVCDVYYEKREYKALSEGDVKNKYDTYLCLRINDPEEFVGVINKNLAPLHRNYLEQNGSKIAH